jgi:cytochrome c peroxidase
MHTGQFGSLDALLDHYNKAPPAAFGRSELKPLGLSDGELGQLRAFLAALSMDVARD